MISAHALAARIVRVYLEPTAAMIAEDWRERAKCWHYAAGMAVGWAMRQP